MEPLTTLSAQLAPFSDVTTDDNDLYVDWLRRLDTSDDIKLRLVNSIGHGPGPVVRLFSGQRGVGKTTELNQVRRWLQDGTAGHKVFTSVLFLERWVHLDDLQPEDLIFEIVRQLVTDLDQAGFRLASTKFRNALGSIGDFVRGRFALEGAEIGGDPLKVNLRFEAFPSKRKEFRVLLQGLLPTIYDLINTEILTAARGWLAKPENGGYSGVVVIVDQLDRLPRSANYEKLFLDYNSFLRSLDCDVLYTIPIELAYSRSNALLQDVYGSPILTLPAIPVSTRHGAKFEPGIALLREIVRRRADKAGVPLDAVFTEPDLLDEVVRYSGGHVRQMLVMLQSILDRAPELPIGRAAVIRGLRRAAADLAVPLRSVDWQLLAQVHAGRHWIEEDQESWSELLRDRFVLVYEDADGYWFDRNPLLELVDPEKDTPR